jgi:hypothetical protein
MRANFKESTPATQAVNNLREDRLRVWQAYFQIRHPRLPR